MKSITSLFSSLLLVLILSSQVFASVTVFTSRAAWEAALGIPAGSANLLSGFEMDTPMVFTPGTTALTDIDVTLDANPNGLSGIVCCETASNSTIQGQRFDGFSATDPALGATSIEWGFRMNVSAFGADFDQVNNHGIGMNVNGQLVDFRDFFGPAATMEDEGFLGVIASPGQFFDSVEFVITAPDIPGMNAEYWQADNLSFFTVPEPSTGSLFLVGALALCGSRRKRRRQ